MNARETLEALNEFLQGETSLQAATVAKPASKGDSPEIRALNLAGDAKLSFEGTIARTVGRKLDPLAWRLRKLDPIYKPDPDELEWLRVADVEAVTLATGRFDNLAPYGPFSEGEGAYVKRLQYWGVVFEGEGENNAYFFRSLSPTAELKQKPVTALVRRGTAFHVVEEKIFLFDDAIDCFVYGDFLFVMQKNRYRKIFEQMEQVRKRARKAARDLNKKLPIKNFDDFEAACTRDARLADKVIAIRQRDYFDELSYELVKPVIDEFQIEIATHKGANGRVELEFQADPVHRFRILKLVDDDYLRSSMTQRRYEVNSKTIPG